MRKLIALFASGSIFYFSSCTKDAVQPETADTSYPAEIEEIMVKKCATAGCHNSTSKNGASDLDLSTWQKMFEGNNLGAVTIPYSNAYSPVFTFTNSYSSLGVTAQLPKMPLYTDLLTKEEVSTIKTWIDNGARNKNGDLRWPLDPDRKKFYVVNQACDNMFIFDLKTQLAMAVKEVGLSPGVTPWAESPHQIKFTPDGKYYLVAFYDRVPPTLTECYIERYRASDDMLVDRVELSHGIRGTWGTFAISPDSKRAYSVDYENSRIASINLETTLMTEVTTLPFQFLNAPHGITVSQDNNYIYITGSGNEFWKMDVNDLTNSIPPISLGAPGSRIVHEVAFDPDSDKYYLTCPNTSYPGEVRVFDNNDSFLTSITIGGSAKPLEMAFSTDHNYPYLFVTVQDEYFDPRGPGYVAVINYQTDLLETKIFTGPQPHGIAFDPEAGLVYVANTIGGGHHATDGCGGANGNVVAIDVKTLKLFHGFKPEVGGNPYAVAVRPD